jgi:hypothetical protein
MSRCCAYYYYYYSVAQDACCLTCAQYHGGTNFDRTSGGPFIATSYDYDAPIDEYGLLRQPKWGHLRDLHKAIKQAEPALVSGDPTIQSIGNYEKVQNPLASPRADNY